MDRQIDWYGRTDVGQKRGSNQDQYLIADLRRVMTLCDTSLPQPEHQRLVGNTAGKLLVVADGVGGHLGGERASSIAVATISHYVLNMMLWFLKLSDEREDDFRDELSQCLSACETALKQKADDDPIYRKMGTTVTMAYIIWPRMYVVHAGDSRCYLLSDGKLEQVTHDHSMAQLLLETGGIDRKEADTGKLRHVLWNAVGANGTRVHAEVGKVLLQEDDVVLLCSDGLHGPVDDFTIAEILGRTTQTAEEITAALVAAANEAGGPDNITAVMARFPTPPNSSNDCQENAIGVSATAFADQQTSDGQPENQRSHDSTV